MEITKLEQGIIFENIEHYLEVQEIDLKSLSYDELFESLMGNCRVIEGGGDSPSPRFLFAAIGILIEIQQRWYKEQKEN